MLSILKRTFHVSIFGERFSVPNFFFKKNAIRKAMAMAGVTDRSAVKILGRESEPRNGNKAFHALRYGA